VHHVGVRDAVAAQRRGDGVDDAVARGQQRGRYHRADFDMEGSLVLSYGGEEYVAATVISPGRGPVQRAEIVTGTAHTAFQMRRALDRQAAAVRDFPAH
jgi:hypothetical protein